MQEIEGPDGDGGELEPAVDTPIDMRPDLTVLGIDEIERGVCEDTYENRNILRQSQMNWDAVYAPSGKPTGWIAARTKEMTRERRVLSMREKEPLLENPKDINSEYITGLDLIIDDTASRIAPPWVVGMTKKWHAEQEAGGPVSAKRAPIAKPHRCRITKGDGLRCMLWASGRPKDDGLCRIHLKTQRKPGEDIERARRKLVQAAPYAVDKLEELMQFAESEPVKLKASTEILDRAGLRAGMDINLDVEVTDARQPADIVAERLANLAAGAQRTQRLLAEIDGATAREDVVDAEVVETSEPAAGSGEQDKEIFTPEEDENTTAASEGLSPEELEEL